MKLIIVESPTKARTLTRFLGSDYQIEASMGHVRDLPESKLGVDVDHDFAPQYVVSAKKKDTVAKLQTDAAKANTVILATDPDREGEAIAFHISELIKDQIKDKRSKTKDKKKEDGNKREIQRITFHEITETAIKEALAHPGSINMQLVDSQQARRVLDRLVGYKLSPLLWRKVRKGLSAGRVQSVAVRLIVEREREILAFKAEEYWEVVANLKQTADSRQQTAEFEAKLSKIDDKTVEIKTKEEADRIVAELNKAEYKISNITAKEVRRYPYPPFTTSTLQQTASNLFGWSAKRTMQVAQNLYEQGLITYHRTDSTNLAVEAVDLARSYIASQLGEKYLPAEPKLYKTKSKVAQEAHEAIRPTNVQVLGSVDQGSDRDQSRLYELIWKRFLACQMAEAIYEQTGVDIVAILRHSGEQKATPESLNIGDSGHGQNDEVKYLFRANGSRQIFDGWRKLYQDKIKDTSSETQDGSGENGEGNMELPKLAIEEMLQLMGLLPSQHFTQPPPRFNEASLIKTLEEYGIGRPSTYAPIISTIQERQYVEKVEKKLQPTNLGFAVNDFLMANFPNIFDYQFTAKMEDELDEVANGEKQWVPVIREFYTPFSEQLEKAADTADRVKIETEISDELCPEHNVPLVVRIGKFGKFLACSKFPECKFTKSYQVKINVKCPKCLVGDVIMRKTRTKKSFYGCNRYPDCDYASWTKPKVTDGSEATVDGGLKAK